MHQEGQLPVAADMLGYMVLRVKRMSVWLAFLPVTIVVLLFVRKKVDTPVLKP